MAARPRPLIARGAALVLLCLLVGLLLDSLGVSAHGLLHDTGHTLLKLWRLLIKAIEWAVPYILLGAIIVVPAALLRFAWLRARRR
jgi:hypothetical protein